MESSASAGRVASAVLDRRRWWALRIFRSRTLADADALTILIGAVAVGMPFVLTLYAHLVLMAAGWLVLTQVSIHGLYFPDIFAGRLLCGPGIGLGSACRWRSCSRPTAEASARAARAGPGGRCRCRRRRGDQVRNEMSEQRTDSYHPRRPRPR